MNRKSTFLFLGALLMPALLQAQASVTARPEDAKRGSEVAPAVEPTPPSAFVADFAKHWMTAKELAVAVAEAMPAANYSFKPTPEEMSFGEQMNHMAQANFGYCAFIAEAKSPFEEPGKDAKLEKADVTKHVAESFDYCSNIFSKVSDAQLDMMHGSGDHKFATRDVMLGVMVHMAHHRGQAEVYLRLKGIKPPDYKW